MQFLAKSPQASARRRQTSVFAGQEIGSSGRDGFVGSDSQLIQASNQHILNHLGGATIGLVVAADGVGHVAAGGVEQKRAGARLRAWHGADRRGGRPSWRKYSRPDARSSWRSCGFDDFQANRRVHGSCRRHGQRRVRHWSLPPRRSGPQIRGDRAHPAGSPARCANRSLQIASAIGLRQVLPVQTKRIITLEVSASVAASITP